MDIPKVETFRATETDMVQLGHMAADAALAADKPLTDIKI